MKVSAEKKENQQIVLTIEVEAAEVTKAEARACKNIAGRVNIPGFRKGKAPKNIVERHVGKEYIMDEAFDLMYPSAFRKALDEQELYPVTRPEVDVVTLESGKDLVFKATFTNRPEVTLGEYKDLKVEKKAVEITDEDVDKQISNFRDRQGKLVDVPEGTAVADGDFTTLDFKGFVDGESFEGGEGVDYPLQIGSGNFIPGFEEQLIGAKIDEEKEVNVTFPEEYHAKELAGKPAVFKCTVRSIKHKELPPLDDELAKKVSKFDTLEELKADIRKNLQENAQRTEENERKKKAVEMAAANITVDIPPVMIDDQVEHMIQQFSLRLSQQGLSLENYLQYSGTDLSKIKEEYREPAEKEVRKELMLQEVAKAEDIRVGSEDLDQRVNAMAALYGTTPKQVQKILKEQGRFGDFATTVLFEKVEKFITDHMTE